MLGKVKRFLLPVVLVGALMCPSVAWATVEGDQTPLPQDEIDRAIREGAIGGPDEVDRFDENVASPRAMFAASSSPMIALQGANRYETAAAQTLYAYPNGCGTVIVASGVGNAWADALSATGLAGALDCPILFVSGDSIPQITSDTIVQMGASQIVLIGGESVVAPSIETDLGSLSGVSSVRRIGGADRYATQMAIYEFGLKDHDGSNYWNNDMVLVASGANFPDALSASPLAFAKGVPMFLVGDDGNLLEAQEKLLLNASFNTAVLLGKTGVVSEETFGYMEALAYSSASGHSEVIRLGGDNRYETSAVVAEWCVQRQYLAWNDAAVASGDVPYDALAGSVVQGKDRAVLLVVSDASSSSVSALVKAHSASIDRVKFFGSKAAVSGPIRMEVANALSIPFSLIPDFKVYVDAGHGWNDSNNGVYDSGATGSGYQEAALTKELAGMVTSILRSKYGIDVFLNDDGGWYKLRHAEAKAQGCDAIVSIHFNAGGGTGTETLIHNYHAAALSPLWQSRIHPGLCAATGLVNRGMKTQQVAIVGGTLPATLLEVCFIDNGYDMVQYQARKVQVAEAIAEGIAR